LQTSFSQQCCTGLASPRTFDVSIWPDVSHRAPTTWPRNVAPRNVAPRKFKGRRVKRRFSKVGPPFQDTGASRLTGPLQGGVPERRGSGRWRRARTLVLETEVSPDFGSSRTRRSGHRAMKREPKWSKVACHLDCARAVQALWVRVTLGSSHTGFESRALSLAAFSHATFHVGPSSRGPLSRNFVVRPFVVRTSTQEPGVAALSGSVKVGAKKSQRKSRPLALWTLKPRWGAACRRWDLNKGCTAKR